VSCPGGDSSCNPYCGRNAVVRVFGSAVAKTSRPIGALRCCGWRRCAATGRAEPVATLLLPTSGLSKPHSYLELLNIRLVLDFPLLRRAYELAAEVDQSSVYDPLASLPPNESTVTCGPQTRGSPEPHPHDIHSSGLLVYLSRRGACSGVEMRGECACRRRQAPQPLQASRPQESLFTFF